MNTWRKVPILVKSSLEFSEVLSEKAKAVSVEKQLNGLPCDLVSICLQACENEKGAFRDRTYRKYLRLEPFQGCFSRYDCL